jgi:hypothetical protein
MIEAEEHGFYGAEPLVPKSVCRFCGRRPELPAWAAAPERLRRPARTVGPDTLFKSDRGHR